MGLRNAGLVRVGFRRGNQPLVSSTVQFWVAAADASVPSAKDLSGITGLVKSTAGTPSAAVAGTDYVYPAGVAGGQSITGGTAASEILTLSSTANATKGTILFGTKGKFDEVNGRLRIGDTNAPSSALEVAGNVAATLAGNCAYTASATSVVVSFFANDGGSGGFFQTSSAHDLIFRANGNEVQRLTSANQNLLVGTTTDVATTKVRVNVAKSVASAAAAIWNGLEVMASTLTITGGTNITTSLGVNAFVVGQPTLSAGTALTVTSAATLAIAGPPITASNAALTNTYSLWAQADPGATRPTVVRFDSNSAGAVSGFGRLIMNSTGGSYAGFIADWRVNNTSIGTITADASNLIISSSSNTNSVVIQANGTTGVRVDNATGGVNVVLCGTTGGMGGATGVVQIINRVTAPTGNPTGGGILYCQAGTLRYRGTAGTDVQLAAA